MAIEHLKCGLSKISCTVKCKIHSRFKRFSIKGEENIASIVFILNTCWNSILDNRRFRSLNYINFMKQFTHPTLPSNLDPHTPTHKDKPISIGDWFNTLIIFLLIKEKNPQESINWMTLLPPNYLGDVLILKHCLLSDFIKSDHNR